MSHNVSVVRVFKDSFNQLVNNPPFFLMALIYFLLFIPLFLIFVNLMPFLESDNSADLSLVLFNNLWLIIPLYLLLIFFGFLSNIFYIIGAREVRRGKKLVFKTIFKKSLNKFPRVFISSLLLFSLLFLIFLAVNLISINNPLLLIFSLFVFILILIIFSYLNPILIFNNKSIIDSIKFAFNFGIDYLGKTIVYFLIISLLSFIFSIIPFINFLLVTLLLQPLAGISLSSLYLELSGKR